MANDLYWLVSFGESRALCGILVFEDVLPPENYGGLDSPLGSLGYSARRRCYGVRLTIEATLESADGTSSRTTDASGRAIVRCGRFRTG